MRSQHKIGLQRIGLVTRVVVDQLFGDPADPKKGNCDQYQQTNSEQELGFSFQTRFAKDSFDAAIGHEGVAKK